MIDKHTIDRCAKIAEDIAAQKRDAATRTSGAAVWVMEQSEITANEIAKAIRALLR